MNLNDQQFRFSTTINVRFGDMDAMGHVNNATYLTYFEQARVEYYIHLFGRKVEEMREQSFIIAEATVKFRAPAVGGDRLQVFARISRMGVKSFDLEYRIVNAETRQLIAEGTTVQVMYDYERRVTLPIPDTMKEVVETFEGITDVSSHNHNRSRTTD